MKNTDSRIVKKDYTQGTLKEETDRLEAEIKRDREEAEKARIEAERKRLEEEEQERKRLNRILYRKPKPKTELYTPSRLLDVRSDVSIMNIEENVKSVKEFVVDIDRTLVEVAEYIFRKDEKKLLSFRNKRMRKRMRK